MKIKLRKRLMALVMALLMAFTVVVPGNLTLGHMDSAEADSLIDISGYSISGLNTKETYTGSAIEPTLTVKKNLVSTLAASNYTVTYSNNINVGTATVTVTGNEDAGYTGTLTATFTIEAAGLSSATMSLVGDTTFYYAGYNGTSHDYTASTNYKYYPDVVVTCGGNTLTEGTDYTLTYAVSGAIDEENVEYPQIIFATGTGNYTGSCQLEFKISYADISTMNIVLSSDTESYTGSEIKPEVTIVNPTSGFTLVEGLDYELSYSDNVNVGTATVTITGLDGYADSTATANFEIVSETVTKTSIADATVSVANATYTGSSVTPDLTVTLGGNTLIEGTDYTAVYSNNISAADSTSTSAPTVVIYGKGSYTGSKTTTFTINPKDISNTTVTAAEATYLFGNSVTTTFSVTDTDRSVTLKSSSTSGTTSDYSYAYSNNKDAGQGTITIRGLNNYTGTKTVYFTINPYDGTKLSVTVGDATYDGNSALVEPTVTIQNSGKTLTLTEGTDYTLDYTNSSDYSSGTVTITYKGNYTGTVTESFTIDNPYRTSIADASVTLEGDSYTYTGSQITPAVTSVVLNGVTLTEDTDYTVSYGSNTNVGVPGSSAVGTGTVTITGIGNYNDSTTASFDITRANITNCTVTYDSTPAYDNGNAVKPEVTLTYNNITLVEGTDYSITYNGDAATDGTGVGTGYITILSRTDASTNFWSWFGGSSDDSYAGTKAALVYTVTASSVDIADLVLEMTESYQYTGEAIEPDLTLTFNSTTLTVGTDYKVTYTNNTNPGTATATITALGDTYTGSRTVNFTITKRNINTLSPIIDADGNSYAYTGSAITPVLTGFNGSVTVSDLTRFTLVANGGENCIDAGTYAFTVTANDDNEYFTGSVSDSFWITAYTYTDVTITFNDGTSSYEYTGEAIKPEVTVYDSEGNVIPSDRYTLTYSGDTTNAGDPIVIVTFSGNYKGTFTANYKITRKSLNDVTVSDIGTQIYTGSAIEPEVVVTDDSTTLAKGTDYTVTYADNTEVGTATVTITGINNYTDTVTKTFDIKSTATDISAAEISAIASQTYTGSAIEPAVTVTYDGTALTADTDYTVRYTNNINVGTATVTVTGAGDYTGTITAAFTITAASLDGGAVTLEGTSYTYTGSDIEPAVTVINAAEDEISSSDYDVAYSGNTNVGTATVTVSGKGNYTGTLTTSFVINAKDIANCEIDDIEGQIYTGSAIEPDISITYNGVALVLNEDYTVAYSNNTNVTKGAEPASAVITGIENYTGSVTKTFTISKEIVSIENATVSVDDSADLTYDGSAKTPAITVTYGGETLTENVDYTVAYKDNTDAGTATITVTGMEDYNGTNNITFDIAQRDITGYEINLGEFDKTYTGEEIDPVITSISYGTYTAYLTEDSFEVSVSDNINVGDVTITITGSGNYTGTTTATYTIEAASIESAEVTAEDVTYTGAAVVPTDVTVSLDGNELTSGTDYTISYSNNTDVGQGVITITGKGNYTGTLTGYFKIVAKDIADCTFSTVTAKEYTGSAIKPEIEVTDGTETLVSGTDYTVTYSNNINATTTNEYAVITITGIGNYQGQAEIKFSIAAKDLSNASVTGISDSYYTGDAVTFDDMLVSLDGTALVGGTDYEVAYSGNTQAGKATVVITGTGNYTGSITKSFTITKYISDCTISTIPGQVFTGNAIEPEIAITDGDTTLVEGEDFEVTYENNINVTTSESLASAIITGLGNYEGTVEITFSISREVTSIADAEISEIADQTYTGSAITPAFTVTYDGTELTLDEDYSVSYSDNTNVGTATITITGHGDYTGTVTRQFAINAISIEGAVITVSDVTYTGSAMQPDVTVTLDGEVLDEDTDYTVAYSNNTNAGTATVTVTGINNYTGEIEKDFTINQCEISDTDVSDIAGQEWTGTEVEPEITVTSQGKTLTAGTDYTVAYYNNTDETTGSTYASAVITAKGNYTGEVTKYFTITKGVQSIEDAKVTGASDTVYTGSAITPDVTVTLDGAVLTKDTDYTVAYKDNTDAGTATVIITGTGSYTGSVSTTFVISPLSINDMTVVLGSYESEYTGKAIKPDVTALGNITDLTGFNIIYSNNIDVGTATVTISPASDNTNYTGSADATYTITAKSISAAVISADDQTYTGSAIGTTVIVVLGGVILEEGTDYTLAYTENTDAGTATVTITGSGNYTGTKSGSFTISAISMDDVTVEALSDVTYSGSANKPAPVLTWNGTTLTVGKDYTVSYSADTVNVGTVTVTITGVGNFTGDTAVTFDIVEQDISDATVDGVSDCSYTGEAITFDGLTVTTAAGIKLDDTDYTVTYSNNINIGTAAITITGRGNYTGSVTVNFEIGKVSIASAVIDGISDMTYTGSALTQSGLSVTLGGTVLTVGEDYTVAYTDNTDAGTATIEVTGTGSYTGTVSTTFTIEQRNFSDGVTLMPISGQEYTGSAIEPDVIVMYQGSALKAGTDYTVAYSDNINIGTATVTVTGAGNFTGTLETEFTIASSLTDISDYQIEITSDATYTGEEVSVTYQIKDAGGNVLNLTYGTDYKDGYTNNVNAGTATLTVVGYGEYTGTITKTFTISPYEISSSNATAALSKTVYTYDGEAKTPSVTSLTITNASGTQTVISDLSDFDISYADNTDAGNATVTITAKDGTNYTGSITVEFEIAEADISNATVTAADQTYTGSALTTDVTVTLDGTVLKEGTDYEVSYASNTNAGTATVTITGKGNYSGTADATFTISAKSIGSATVTAADATYTGSAVTTDVTVVLDGKTLTAGDDYTVSYSNNIEATDTGSKAVVTVTGTGNYTGSVEATFDIVMQSIADAVVTGVEDTTYNRGAIVQDNMVVTLDGVTLTAGTDYTVTYADNVNVGTASITITGAGIYTGTLSQTFTISAWDVTGEAVIADIDDCAYAGTAITPTIKVTVNGKTLTADEDYTVSYSNNIDCGTANAAVTFIGNYTGTAEQTFTIIAKDLADCTIGAIGTLVYTGSAIEPSITVTNGDVTLTLGVDYTAAYSNNINVTDAAVVTITAVDGGNYTGTASATFAIVKEIVDISKTDVADITGITYTGEALEPALTITYNGYTLVADQDYEAVYSDNVVPGTATIVITGKESFTGSITVTFEIGKMDISDFDIELDDTSYEYTGSTIKPEVVEVSNATYTVPLSNVTVTYGTNTETGTGTVTVTANSDSYYTGTVSTTFDIEKADLTNAVVSVSDDDLAYTGSAQTPTVTVTLDGKTISSSNYTAVYSNNVNAGDTALVTITGTGNYEGSVTAYFTIAQKDLADCTADDIAAIEYDGNAKEPDVTLRNGSLVLEEGIEYTVAYSNNVNTTDAAVITITAVANGNYTGSLVKNFTISAIDMSDAQVTGISDAEYTGSAITFDGITVTLDGEILTEDTDYTISYANNTAAGTATVTIKGIGNYTGEITETFEISSIDISDAVIDGVSSSVTYKGSAYTFDLTVTLNGETLTSGTDYTVSYSNNTNVGTATITITGKGNYEGSVQTTFEIVAKSISGGTVTASNKVYTGSALKPSVTVKLSGSTLSSSDYTVAYSNNTNVGTATITITGKGNYTGTITGSFNIIPKAPTGLKFVTGTTSTVTISWSKVTGASSYKIYRYNTSSKKYTYIGTTTSLSYKASSLSTGTYYTFAVSAVGKASDGTSLEGSKTSIYTNTAPAAITTLKCTAKTSQAIKLTWNKVSGCSGYRIFRYDSATKSYITLKTVTSATTSYVDTGLKASTAYRYIVRPYINNNGKVLWGAVKAVNVGTRPTSVSGLKCTARGTNSIKLTWTRNTTATGYVVYRYNPSSKSWTRVKVITNNATTTFIGTGLKAGTSYIYRVYTYKTFSGGNVYGTGVSIKDTTRPAIPAAVVKSGSKKATVTWTAVTGAVGYEVYMSTSYSGTYTKIGTTKSTVRTLTKTGLKKGRTYYFKVRAYRVLNGVKIYSGYSTIKKVVVK